MVDNLLGALVVLSAQTVTFITFFALFYTFNDKENIKSCFSVKKLIKRQKLISTIERRAEHLFAGRNTQHPTIDYILGPRGQGFNGIRVVRILKACP